MRRRYGPIIETVHDGICMRDADLVTLFVNPRLAAMFGYSVEEMGGRPFSDLRPRPRGQRNGTLCGNLAPEGEHVQVQYRPKDGSELWPAVSRTRGFGEDVNVDPKGSCLWPMRCDSRVFPPTATGSSLPGEFRGHRTAINARWHKTSPMTWRSPPHPEFRVRLACFNGVPQMRQCVRTIRDEQRV
jgi:PAS domain S-box-containing protein